MRIKLLAYTFLVVILNFLPVVLLAKTSPGEEGALVIVALVLGFFMFLSYLSYFVFMYNKVWEDVKKRNIIFYLPLVLFVVLVFMYSYKEIPLMISPVLYSLFGNLGLISLFHVYSRKAL